MVKESINLSHYLQMLEGIASREESKLNIILSVGISFFIGSLTVLAIMISSVNLPIEQHTKIELFNEIYSLFLMLLLSAIIFISGVVFQRKNKNSIVNKINNLRKYIIKADEQVDLDIIRKTMNIMITDIEESQKLGQYLEIIDENLGYGFFIVFFVLISSFITLLVIGQTNLYLLLGIVIDLVLFFVWYKWDKSFSFW